MTVTQTTSTTDVHPQSPIARVSPAPSHEELTVITDIEQLEPNYKVQAKAFLLDLAGLPVQLYETRRSLARQAYLCRIGASRANGANGPHPWRLACDIILDVHHVYWNDKKTRPQIKYDAHGRAVGGAAWDIGLDDHGHVLRQDVFDVVMEMGRKSADHGMIWGGSLLPGWKISTAPPGYPLGFDPFHFQQKEWAALTAHLPPPT